MGVDLADALPGRAACARRWPASRPSASSARCSSTTPAPSPSRRRCATPISPRSPPRCASTSAATLLCAAFLDATRAGAGSGACSTSPPAWVAARWPAAVYCAAKAGMDHLSRCLALEEESQPNGARVVSLAPGVIDTDVQVQLRGADAAAFPDRERFVALHREGQLSSAGRPPRACSPAWSAPTSARSRWPTCANWPDAFLPYRRRADDASPRPALCPCFLAACAAPAPDADAPAARPRPSHRPWWRPTPTRVAQGIPPSPPRWWPRWRAIPISAATTVEWHPQRRELLVSHRKAGASTLQLFRVAAPLAEPGRSPMPPSRCAAPPGSRAAATTSCSRAATAATRPTSSTASTSPRATSRC